jgi:hypothetical protein
MPVFEGFRMRHLPGSLVVVASLVVAGCGGNPLVPKVQEAPSDASKTGQANLLLFPIEDAEDLLGRAVQLTQDGAWTIADARAPGCEVSVQRVKAAYSTHRRVDVGSMTAVSAGYAKLVGFEAHYGHTNKADIDIKNTAILKADLRGACGENVVDTVFVGTGKRALLAEADLGGKLAATLGPVTPGAETQNNSALEDSTEWETEQAYGFTYKKLVETEPLGLVVSLPPQIKDGDRIEGLFTTSQKAWLVAFYLEEDGKGDVLWPSNEEPEPTSQPDKPAKLPSAKERAQGMVIKAALRDPKKAARESLVVYAFREKADFDRLKPQIGGTSDDGAGFAASITKKIKDVPMSRWSRAVTSYVIEPKR